jgi:hypothetical protein
LRALKSPASSDEFPAWAARLETGFRRIVWLLAALLLVAQLAMQSSAVREWLSPTDRIEGSAYRTGSGH